MLRRALKVERSGLPVVWSAIADEDTPTASDDLDAQLLEFLLEPEPTAPAELDARLLEFLMESMPPPFELGSRPPPVIMASIPPGRPILASAPPAAGDGLAEQIVVPDISAVDERQRRPAPPPVPPPTTEMRVRKILMDLRAVGPGDEAPFVQALLSIGEACLPAVRAEFPGLLWFDRRLPHSKVPRGRDVSPLARALVAFGARSEPVVKQLMEHESAEIRFYATLVAAELATPDLLESLGARVLDRDPGIRLVASGCLAGLSPAQTEPIRARLRTIVTVAERDPRVWALRALGLMRDAPTVKLAVRLFDPMDVEQTDVVVRALTFLTARQLPSQAEWERWVEAHGEEPRARWLCDSLDVEHADLNGFAVRELEAMTGAELGFDPEGGKKERKRVQRAAKKLL